MAKRAPARSAESSASRSMRASESGTTPSQYFSTIAMTRLARLPSPLASSDVYTVVEALPGEIAVAVERNFAEQEIAERVGAESADRFVEVELHAGRLAEALAAERDEAVRPHALRERQLGRLQHRGPDHAVQPRDVLADHVQLRRPPVAPPLVRDSRSPSGSSAARRTTPTCPAARRSRSGAGRESPTTSCERVIEMSSSPCSSRPRISLRRDSGWMKSGRSARSRSRKGWYFVRRKNQLRSCRPLQRPRRMQNALAVDDLVVLLERLAADAVPPFVRLLVEVVRATIRGCA